MADSTVETLDEMLRESRAVRRKFEGQWFLNLAMYEGHQWIAFDGRHLFEPQLEPWRAKIVDNRIRPSVRKSIAKKTKTRPVWVGVPDGDDDKAIADARVDERVLEHYWRELNMTRKRRAALLWADVCSAGFWKVFWDSGKGNAVDVLVYAQGHPQAGKVVKDGAGMPFRAERLQQLPPEVAQTVAPKRVNMGDVEILVRSPWEIFPDPLAGEEGLSSAEWIMEEAVYSVQYVRSRYGWELEPDAGTSAGVAQSRMPSLSPVSDNEKDKRGVRVREFWALPGSDYPKGKKVVWAQDKTVEEDCPYPWLPYAMFRGTPVPGRFWPDAPVTDQVPMQTSLNKRKSQIEENADRIGNSPLMRSAVNQDFNWQGLPGEEIEFQDMGTPGSIPQFLQVPELPAYVREDVDRTETSLREISGQHEVTSGQVPAGVTAASAINLLQEQDDTQLGPDIEDMDIALAESGEMVVWLMDTFASDERMIRVAGEENTWHITAFRGRGSDRRAKIEVQSGSGLPQSKAAKQAAIQSVLSMFAQAGIPIGERDMRKVLQQFEIGGLEQFFATIGTDERQVQRENQRLASGVPVEVNVDFDNHAFHIQGHRDFQKTSTYEDLTDPVKALISDHVKAHVMVGANAAAALAGPAGGAPPNGAPPPAAPPVGAGGPGVASPA